METRRARAIASGVAERMASVVWANRRVIVLTASVRQTPMNSSPDVLAAPGATPCKMRGPVWLP